MWACDGQFEFGGAAAEVEAAGFSSIVEYGDDGAMHIVSVAADDVTLAGTLVALIRLVIRLKQNRALKSWHASYEVTSEVAAVALCMIDADRAGETEINQSWWSARRSEEGYIVVSTSRGGKLINAYIVTRGGVVQRSSGPTVRVSAQHRKPSERKS